MYFKAEFITAALALATDQSEPIVFIHERRNPVTVELRAMNEQDPEYNRSYMFCKSYMSQDVNQERIRYFEKILSEKVKMSEVEQKFKEFSYSKYETLREYAVDTIKVLRWRINAEGQHSAIRRTTGFFGSNDGENWSNLPFSELIFGYMSNIPRADKEVLHDVADMMREKVSEPLSHEIYREAASQRFQNTRTAIVLGVSAAEIGCKQLIANLVPKSRWLVEEIPSPPLVKLLREYLPNIDKNIVIPEGMINIIEKYVNMRNHIIHGRRSEGVDMNSAHELLGAVHNLLYLYDYYGGNNWAKKYTGL